LEHNISTAATIHHRDEELAKMAINGNTMAFRLLVERHNQYATRIASRFLLREEDIRDIVQESFIKVWKHLANFDGQCRFTTWFYTIVFNLCLDRLKILRRRHEFPISDNRSTFPETRVFEDPAAHLDQTDMMREVRKHALRLSRVQRLVFTLRDLQDLPVIEVCRITGFDEQKVKANLYYARKSIREKLIREGYL
jgi:RNA polymerase sigma-70 factor (ECF subfamily)